MPRGENNSSRRGFAAMDEDERREIASRGGRASHGGRGHEDENEGRGRQQRGNQRYESRHNDQDNEDSTSGSSRRGFASMDPERQREISSMGGYASHGGRGRDRLEDQNQEDNRSRSNNQRYRAQYEDDEEEDRSRDSSRRGFAAMDPERQREIASAGGRTSHGGSGRRGDDEDGQYDRRSNGSRGYQSLDDDEVDQRRYSGTQRRGFASMDPEQQREIASMGGRASHGGRGRFYEDEGDYRGSTRYSQSRNDSDREDQGREDRGGNRRGFASMDPEERREIARRGGQSSNGGRSRSDQDWSRGQEDH